MNVSMWTNLEWLTTPRQFDLIVRVKLIILTYITQKSSRKECKTIGRLNRRGIFGW